LDHAIFLAKTAGARLSAIHVIENPPTLYIESQNLLNDLLANYRADSAKILDKCKEIADRNGVELETVMAEGDATSNIISHAQKEGFDLIIIGSRGLGKFKEIILGSVSNKVLHHARCSVLVAK
jgi:nucleotide-binding universal stress UspA family protein